MNQDDIDLIRKARQGDLDAFNAIVKNYKHYVYRTAFGILNNPSDAEDAAQETFIKAYQSLSKLRDERSFPAWLARIAMHTSSDWIKANRRHQEVAIEQSHHLASHDAHQLAQTQLDIQDALNQLSEEQRVVIVLRMVHGMDYEEMAKNLDIPIGTVRSRLHHARLRLRELLGEEGGIHS